MLRLAPIIILSLLTFGCGNGRLSDTHLEEERIRTVSIGSLVFRLQYLFNQDSAESDAGTVSFLLNISATDQKDPLDLAVLSKTEAIDYLSWKIFKDFSMVTNKGSQRCVMAHFERTYGLSKQINISLAFASTGKSLSDLKIVYNDQLFNIGRMQFAFTGEEPADARQ